MKQSIPPGYKKTEIGTIPEDWKVKRLGEVFEIISGPFGSSVKKEFFSKSGMPIYSAQNVINNNFKEVNYIDAEYYPKLKQFSVKENDLLITTRGTIGIIKRVPLNVSHGIIHSNLTILRKRQSISTKFIECLLNSYLLKKQLKTILSQTTIDALYANNISKFYIPLPPLSEQRIIARVLSDIDRLIESLDKLIEKKKLIKKGAMQELLTGKKRLPGFKGEWVRKKLGEIFFITRGLVLATKYMKKERIGKYRFPVYSSQTQNNGVIGFYDKFLYEDAITWTTDGANAGDVKFRKGKFYCTNVCGVLLNEEGYSNQCIAEIFGMVSKKYVSYVGNPKLMNNVVKNIEITFPPTLSEQRAIAQILSDMDAEIEALEKKKQKYEMMKKAAMELLLTGKIRLKEYVKGMSI